MPIAARIRLRHAASGRNALIVMRHDWLDGSTVEVRGKRYILLAAHQRSRPAISAATARRWIDAGAAYICCWGSTSDDAEEAFDRASFLEELGVPLPFTLMTTSHGHEPLEEALWFAFYNAKTPGGLTDPLDIIVIVVDKPALALRCESWVRNNHE
jgi:hypothetical protein